MSLFRLIGRSLWLPSASRVAKVMFSVVSVRQSFCPLGVLLSTPITGGHVPTCSLQSTDCRKAGGWHSTEMPSCWQLLLEAPDDIYTFKFCPTDPNIIAGGCINGQVVLWDIGKHADRLKTQRGGNKRKILSTLVSTQYSHSQNPPTLWCILYTHTQNSHHSGAYSILPLKTLTTLVHNLYSYSPNSQHSGAYSIVTLTNPQYSHSKFSIL